MVESPFHKSSGFVCIRLGKRNLTVIKAIGPPIITPKEPVKNIISALGPKFQTPFKSMLKHSKMREAGNKY